MATVQRDSLVYSFSKENQPVLRVKAGAKVLLETRDCFGDQLKGPESTLEKLDWDHINPATGPVHVEGAQPGDTLKVTIEKIELAARGIIATGKGLGLLGARIEGMPARFVDVRGGQVHFDKGLSFPIHPMIGVIGVAPADGAIGCGTPGSHGGNMDNTLIAEGASVYFPVAAEGALFGLGDLHAAMGDGEIGVSGVEVAGKVRVKLEVLKGFPLRNPLVANRTEIATIASALTLDEALQRAVDDMADLLLPRLPLKIHDCAMLMSVVGKAQICQVVDPLKTARYGMPRAILAHYDVALP